MVVVVGLVVMGPRWHGDFVVWDLVGMGPRDLVGVVVVVGLIVMALIVIYILQTIASTTTECLLPTSCRLPLLLPIACTTTDCFDYNRLLRLQSIASTATDCRHIDIDSLCSHSGSRLGPSCSSCTLEHGGSYRSMVFLVPT